MELPAGKLAPSLHGLESPLLLSIRNEQAAFALSLSKGAPRSLRGWNYSLESSLRRGHRCRCPSETNKPFALSLSKGAPRVGVDAASLDSFVVSATYKKHSSKVRQSVALRGIVRPIHGAHPSALRAAGPALRPSKFVPDEFVTAEAGCRSEHRRSRWPAGRRADALSLSKSVLRVGVGATRRSGVREFRRMDARIVNDAPRALGQFGT